MAKTIIETNHTYNAFIETYYNAERGLVAKRNEQNESEEASLRFTQTESFEEAYKLAKTGYDTGIEQLDIDTTVYGGAGANVENSVHGSVVNMGAYLEGQPENMYSFREETERNLEPLTIYARLDYSGKVSGEFALSKGRELIELVNELQVNHWVRVVGFIDSNDSGGIRSVCNVIIKDFDERLVINNIAFAFHPSFFRRFWFRYIETKSFISSDYGGIISDSSVRERLKKYHSKTEKAIITPCIDSLRNHMIYKLENVNIRESLFYVNFPEGFKLESK